jgi:hypothetical protein
MTHTKNPRLNGWKYKTFNLNDKNMQLSYRCMKNVVDAMATNKK